MRPYFEKMTEIGKALSQSKIKQGEENIVRIKEVEGQIAEAFEKAKDAGLPAEKINQRGQRTIWQRLEYLVDPGTWRPLHSIFNPANNEEGTTSIVDGLGRIGGKWAVIVGFDNKVMAGAWVAGQSENVSSCHGHGKASTRTFGLAGELFGGQAYRAGGSLSG